jgi:hypothetical protein
MFYKRLAVKLLFAYLRRNVLETIGCKNAYLFISEIFLQTIGCEMLIGYLRRNVLQTIGCKTLICLFAEKCFTNDWP